MATERVGDMTLEELKALITETFEELQDFQKPIEHWNVAEVVERVRQHRRTPPPGSPSNQQLLREERDR